MSTHNICFRREIRKILYGYPLLSVNMKIIVFDERNITNISLAKEGSSISL